MGYEEALEAAGATVLAYAEFGSYQGDWLAKVGDGYIHGHFGSCSGCDGLQAEVGYGNHCDKHEFEDWDCADCKAVEGEKAAEYMRTRYLPEITTKAAIMKEVSEHLEWDMEAQKMVDWLNEN